MNDYQCQAVAAELYLLPVETRVPLKFGAEVLSSVTCARAKITVRGRDGREAVGWGETPLSVQWAWPSKAAYSHRYEAMVAFCQVAGRRLVDGGHVGHPLEIGQRFLDEDLPDVRKAFNASRTAASRESEPLPTLAGLICAAPFDVAMHDAYGNLLQLPVYDTYEPPYLTSDLAELLPGADDPAKFANRYPAHFLDRPPKQSLVAWHLVGGLDPIDPGDLTGDEPADGYPVLLGDWIRRDGLTCLKVKLRGNDARWDFERLVRVAEVGRRGRRGTG